MKMVRADRGPSGVTFTLDTDPGHTGVVYTTATWGLGAELVKGNVDPDEFYVHKDRFVHGYKAVMNRRRGEKLNHMIVADDALVTVPTTAEQRTPSMPNATMSVVVCQCPCGALSISRSPIGARP